MSLPARTAWFTTGADGGWARRRSKQSGNRQNNAANHVGFEHNTVAQQREPNTIYPCGRTGSDYNKRTRNENAMVAWWKRLIYSLVSALLGAGVCGACAAAEQVVTTRMAA